MKIPSLPNVYFSAAHDPAASLLIPMKSIILGLGLLTLVFSNVSCATKKDCSSCSSCEKPAAACCGKDGKCCKTGAHAH